MLTLTHFFFSLFIASCFLGVGIFSIAYLNAVLGIMSLLLNTYWYTSSSYLVHKDFSIQPYPFCTKSSLSNNKLSAISKISSLNRPFLAGIISDTADARLTHLFWDFVQSFNFSIYNGYISKNVPTVWLHKVSQAAQLVTYSFTHFSNRGKSSSVYCF